MSMHVSPSLDPKIVPKSLGAAESDRLRQVVALVDGLSDRGNADAILSPLRDKIALLRPARVMRFPRLLFVPFDGLIMAPAKWRPTELTLPRTVLRPLIEEVRARLPALAAEADTVLKSHQDWDTQIDLGRALWPQAASCLEDVRLPQLWKETELPAHLYPAIARAVILVLRHSPAIMDLATSARAGRPIAPDLMALLAQLGPNEMPFIFAVLMCHLPEPEQLLRLVAVTGAVPGHPELPRVDALTAQARRNSAEAATDTLLTQLERQAASGMLAPDAALGEQVARIANILTGIEDGSASAERKRRAQALRRAFAGLCQKRFSSDLSDALLRPALSLAESDAGSPTQMADIELAVRRLRQLEASARKLGEPAFYQAGLAEATQAIAALPNTEGMDLVDRVRLVELLAGSDAALALYQAAPK